MTCFRSFCASHLSCAKEQAQFEEYKQRRDGKRARFPKTAVEAVTRVGVSWIDSYIPLTREDLETTYVRGAADQAGLKYRTVQDAKQQTKTVVLLEQKPRLEVFCRTEIERRNIGLSPCLLYTSDAADE